MKDNRFERHNIFKHYIENAGHMPWVEKTNEIKTLFNTFCLSTVRHAQRILVLTDNGIVEQGTHDELIALNGTYANLYNMQLRM